MLTPRVLQHRNMANLDTLQRFPNQDTEGRFSECCGEAVADIVGNISDQAMDPGYSYAASFKVSNTLPSTAGTDAYSTMLGALIYGTLPTESEPFDATDNGELYESNFNNYSQSSKLLAAKFGQDGVNTLNSYSDVCNYLSDFKRGCMAVILWYPSFDTSNPDGTLPAPSGLPARHAVAVYEDTSLGLRIKPWLGPSYGVGGYAFLNQANFNLVFQVGYGFNDASRWLSLASAAVTRPWLISDVLPQLLNLSPAPVLAAVATPVPSATIPSMETSVNSSLDKFCLAIRDFEGVPGDANYINNNPGNCRYNEDGYLAKYEPVTKSPSGFAVFPSYAIGWMYLENLISQKIENHPNWTILQFFEDYAPASDNNSPTTYAGFVAKRLGVDSNYQIKNILA